MTLRSRTSTSTDEHACPGKQDVSDLTDILQGLRANARELDRDDLASRLDSWVDRLDQPKVRVVVVGPFNQGKSTLVNTVVGAPVCPVDDISMTAIPIIIEYGPAAEAVAHLRRPR